MRLNLKDWKKVGVENGRTVMQNSAGHTLHIAHKALSAKIRAGLESLPTAMAEGGDVKKEDEPTAPVIVNVGQQPPQMPTGPINLDPNAIAQNIQPNNVIPVQGQQAPAAQSFDVGSLADIGVPAQPPQPAPEMPAPQASAPMPAPASSMEAPAAAANAAPMAPSAQMSPLSGFEQANYGHSAEAAALGKLGKEKAAIQQQAARSEQMLISNFRENTEALEQSRKELAEAVKTNKIDPDRFWENKSTPGKIGTVIGLILGGFGGGLTHQENPALKLLNSQIERDIDSQKANINKTEGLLKMNLQAFGNMKDATEMTRIMMNDAANHKIEQAIAKSIDPQAKAKLGQILGERIQTNQLAQQKLAIERTFDGFMAGEGQDPNKIPAMLTAMRQVDPKRAEELTGRFVPGMGIALTEKDASFLKEKKGDVDKATMGIKELLKLGKRTGKSFSPEDRAQAGTIVAMIKAGIRTPVIGPGAVSESEWKLLDQIVADPTSIFSLDNSTKVRLNTLMGQLNEGLQLNGKSRGIKPVDPIMNLEPQQREWVMWARRNPSDPRSKLTLEKLGIQ